MKTDPSAPRSGDTPPGAREQSGGAPAEQCGALPEQELSTNPIPARIQALLDRRRRSREHSQALRTELQTARTYGLQARHTTKENRA